MAPKFVPPWVSARALKCLNVSRMFLTNVPSMQTSVMSVTPCHRTAYFCCGVSQQMLRTWSSSGYTCSNRCCICGSIGCRCAEIQSCAVMALRAPMLAGGMYTITSSCCRLGSCWDNVGGLELVVTSHCQYLIDSWGCMQLHGE